MLIDAFPDGPVELVGAFTNRMPVNVIVAMLGMPGDDHDRFHDWYSTMMAALVFGKPERPTVCGRLAPSLEMCGASRDAAMRYLTQLEELTRPGR